MIKVTIKGAYGATNFGDDLLMDLFEKYFLEEFSDIEINFEGMYETNYPERFLKKSKYNSDSFEYDWLVFGGGTQFFAFNNHKKSILTLIIKGLKNPTKAIHKISKKIFKEKTIKQENQRSYKTAFLGFGLGPFNNNEKKIESVIRILSNANFVGVRDNVSANYCKEWGVDASFGADIAFSSYFNYNIESPVVDKTQEKKKIGLIVRDWVWEETGRGYYEPLMKLYKEENLDFDFQFIVFAPFKDPNWMKKLEDESFVFWDPAKYSIEQFLGVMNSFDGFISSRFHGAIIGALLKKPVIAIEIEPKLRILTQDIPIIPLWQKPFDIVELKEQLNNLNYEIDYSEPLKKLKDRANYGFKEFCDFFNKNI